MTEKIELIGLSKQELQEALSAIGEKPFRAKQLWQWLYYFGGTDFSKMSNLSKEEVSAQIWQELSKLL